MPGPQGAILSLAQGGPFKVTRRAQGTWVAGEYVTSATPPTVITIAKASIQPLNGEMLTDVPEGLRGDEMLVMYTLERLIAQRKASASDPEVEPDIVTDDATATRPILSREDWFVVGVKHWDALGGYHCRALLSRRKIP